MKPRVIYKSLRASLFDGIFSSCMAGFSAEFIVPYALALRASLAQIGLLTALPNLLSSLAQLFSPELAERAVSKKKIVARCTFLQASMGIPIVTVPYLCVGFEVPALIVFVTLFTMVNAVAQPIWQSWMSDHLPASKRGRYFGWRNRVNGTVTILCLFAAGIILQIHTHAGRPLDGFVVIFSIATISRFLSWYSVTRMAEPRRYRSIQSSKFTFREFLVRLPKSNFAQFTLSAALFTFAVKLSSPFFSVFLLRDLKFNYVVYTVLITTVSIVTILTIGRWGAVADRTGNLKALRVAAFFVASLPFLCIVNRSPYFLFFAQMLSGFAWAGYNLCVLNFIYDVAMPSKRTRCLAYFGAINGVAFFLGALTGGFLATRLPPLLGYRLLSLFLLGGICRFLVALFLFSRIKEVRPVDTMPGRDIIYQVVGFKPVDD